MPAPYVPPASNVSGSQIFSPQALAPYANQLAQQGPAAPATPAPQTGMGLGAKLAMFGGQGADVATTLAAIGSGRFHEANRQGLGPVMAEKAGLLALGMALGHHLARKRANVLGYALGAAGAVPAAINLQRMATNNGSGQ